jgi:hypothetical protein
MMVMDVKSRSMLVELEFNGKHSPRLQGVLNTVEQHT